MSHTLLAQPENLIEICAAEDLVLLMEGADAGLQEISGMSLNLMRGTWDFSDSLAVNYIASFRKLPSVTGVSRRSPRY